MADQMVTRKPAKQHLIDTPIQLICGLSWLFALLTMGIKVHGRNCHP